MVAMWIQPDPSTCWKNQSVSIDATVSAPHLVAQVPGHTCDVTVEPVLRLTAEWYFGH
jgi:hypothetical protein